MEAKQTFKILVNSMPKSGTFLLCKAIDLIGFNNIARRNLLQKIFSKLGVGLPSGFGHATVAKHWLRRIYGYFSYECKTSMIPIGVVSPVNVPAKLMAHWLKTIPIGHYIPGHIPWSLELDKILCQLGYRHILIIRDPRDVLVSFLHYVIKPEHGLSKDFKRLSKDEQLEFAITGGYAEIRCTQVLGIGQAFRSIMNWKQSANCLIVRFESLIGEKGGGLKKKQYETIKKICDYLEVSSDEKFISNLCESVFDSYSPTFRKGQIGAWKKELTSDWIKTFNRTHADLLEELQYDLEGDEISL